MLDASVNKYSDNFESFTSGYSRATFMEFDRHVSKVITVTGRGGLWGLRC
jgi:hypothetical protein